jgi:PAS domain-containing protein
MQLAQPHRIARINYPTRTLAFGYIFVVIAALFAERGTLSGPVLACGIAQFLVYPHLAYLYTRIAADSKRAELNNLLVDPLLLGAWAAQTQFVPLLSCGLLIGPCINNAANRGSRGLAATFVMYATGALGWGAFLGFPFLPDTGPYVAGLCLAGIVGYASWIGVISHVQNRRLLRAREAMRKSEEQFRFVAEHAGDLVAILGPGLRFRYASASHARQFAPGSYAPDASWLDLIHPDDRTQASDYLNMITAEGGASDERAHLRMTTRAGTWMVMECQGNAVWDDRQNMQMVVVILRDVETRVRNDVERQLA